MTDVVLPGIRIETPEPLASGITLVQGSKVFFEDKELHGISGMTVHYEVEGFVRAEITCLHVSANVPSACGEFYTTDPISGAWKKIEFVRFADGTEFPPLRSEP